LEDRENACRRRMAKLTGRDSGGTDRNAVPIQHGALSLQIDDEQHRPRWGNLRSPDVLACFQIRYGLDDGSGAHVDLLPRRRSGEKPGQSGHCYVGTPHGGSIDLGPIEVAKGNHLFAELGELGILAR